MKGPRLRPIEVGNLLTHFCKQHQASSEFHSKLVHEPNLGKEAKMNNVTHLKFLEADDWLEVDDHYRRGWKFKLAAPNNDGVELYAVYINDGQERECHILHCPECIQVKVEVYHLDWKILTCPHCGREIELDRWITEEEVNLMSDEV